MPKLADLEIKEFDTVLPAGYSSDVVHISSRIGIADGRTRYYITNCNRTLETPVNTVTIRFWQEPDQWRWKVCPRCGTVEDYEQAYSDMERQWEENAQRNNERRIAEMAERERQWNEQQARLLELKGELVRQFEVALKDDQILIRYNGHTYQVTEVK